MRVILGFLLGGGFVASAADGPAPVLTVCEALKDIGRYDGKAVIVVGRLTSTEEGGWLNAECGFKVVSAGRDFETSISVTYVRGQVPPPPALPLDFKWDERVLRQKLAEVETIHPPPAKG